jgi:hypothetical protein
MTGRPTNYTPQVKSEARSTPSGNGQGSTKP